MSSVRALLFDAGNTRLKWGLLAQGRIGKSGSITHEKLHDSGFGVLTANLPRDVDTVLVSNVAGQTFATRLSGVIGLHCNCDVHFARAEREGYGVTNSYRRPRRIGVDRWVAMVGAYAEFRSALCVVDAGTAVTIDAVDRSGTHLGGMIVPGLSMMAGALHVNTREIPLAKRNLAAMADAMNAFANTTEGAVQNGALTAISGAIERSVRLLRAAGFRPKVVLTGGDASRILKLLDANVLHRPNLVLEGLAFMVQSEK
ncbi:MAG TPA: type III pantothenate kinase [Woeseiaceae bacterium]|nr:type III pantothenate kinase [Woeseiaceae bacterium]